MAAQPLWIFGLYDANGSLLADLSIASGRSISIALNTPTSVTFQVPLSHPTAALITPLSTYVKGYRQSTDGTRLLKFYGPVWVDEISSGQGVDMLQATALDPMAYLDRRYTSSSFTTVDRGQIIKSIIDTANGVSAIPISTTAGTITASSTLTADYSGEQPSIMDVINQFAEANDGCDTEIAPQELASGAIGRLNVYNRKGSYKANAVFAYGDGTLANCTSITRSRNADNVANYVLALEGDATSIWQNATSIASNRRLDSIQSLSTDTNLLSMSARTRRYLDTHDTPDKVSEYRITPGPRAPRYFDAFEVGDTMRVWFESGQVQFASTQRVYAVQLDIDDAGRETISSIDTRLV